LSVGEQDYVKSLPAIFKKPCRIIIMDY